MRASIRGFYVLSVCFAVQLSAYAAPIQIGCDGGLTQSDNGTVDQYFCTGNMTLSNGSLVVADTFDLTAQGNLALVGVSIQAKSIELNAQNSLSIDSGSTLNTLAGSSGGVLAVNAGGYGAILGTYMGSTIPTPGAAYVGRVVIVDGSGLLLLAGSQPIAPQGDLIIAVPESSATAMALLGLTLLGVAVRRKQD